MSKKSPDRAEIMRLRTLAHALRPVVMLGRNGLSEAVTRELDEALGQHELVKVKLAAEGKEACNEQAEALAKATDATLVQRIGHVAVLYRPDPESSKPVRGPATQRAVGAAPGGRGPAAGRGPGNSGFGGKGAGKGGMGTSRRTGKRGDR